MLKLVDDVKVPAVQTRLELAAEATEDFVLAIMAHAGNRVYNTDEERHAADDDYATARARYKEAIHALALPTWRVVDGGHQPQEAIGEDRVVCLSCDRHHPCHLGSKCSEWALAIRAKIDSAPDTLPAVDHHIDAKGKCTECNDDPVGPGEGCPFKACPHEGPADVA